MVFDIVPASALPLFSLRPHSQPELAQGFAKPAVPNPARAALCTIDSTRPLLPGAVPGGSYERYELLCAPGFSPLLPLLARKENRREQQTRREALDIQPGQAVVNC